MNQISEKDLREMILLENSVSILDYKKRSDYWWTHQGTFTRKQKDLHFKPWKDFTLTKLRSIMDEEVNLILSTVIFPKLNPAIKYLIIQKDLGNLPAVGRLRHFHMTREKTTSDLFIVDLVLSYHIPFLLEHLSYASRTSAE